MNSNMEKPYVVGMALGGQEASMESWQEVFEAISRIPDS